MFTCYFNFTNMVHFACVQRALNILERSILFTRLDVVFWLKRCTVAFSQYNSWPALEDCEQEKKILNKAARRKVSLVTSRIHA